MIDSTVDEDQREKQSEDQDTHDDPADFAAVYDRYFARVYNYVRYRVRDAQLTDDLTAQIFERALTYADSYHPERGAYDAWLFAIARGVVSNHYRRNRLRRWLSFERLPDHPSDLPSPEHATLEREEHARLLAVVARLPDRERDLIALKFGAGLSHREIGEMTALTENYVGVILHRALRKLKAGLESG